MPKKFDDVESQFLTTLSQKVASKKDLAYLKDYAMNVNADKIAVLDILIEKYEKLNMSKIVEFLKDLREKLKRIGEARYVMNADVLTNLGLKLGKRGKTISGIKADSTETE